MEKYLLVLLGGAAGSLARYVAGTALMSRFTGRFPLGTLFVNVSGCFLIGVIMTMLAEKPAPHPNWPRRISATPLAARRERANCETNCTGCCPARWVIKSC